MKLLLSLASFVTCDPIAFDASDFGHLDFVLLFWYDQLTICLSMGDWGCHLNSHGLCFSCKAIICSISNGCTSLSSKGLLLHTRFDGLFASVDLHGVGAHALPLNKIIDVSACFDSSGHGHVSSNSNFMLNWSSRIWYEVHGVGHVEFAVADRLVVRAHSKCA